MHFLPVLLCLIHVIVAETYSIPRMSALKLNLVTPQNEPEHQERKTLKPLSERRNLSLFPKINKKFVLTPKPNEVWETVRPISRTRKPLMKKLSFLNKIPKLKNTDVELETRQPIMDNRLNKENKFLPKNLYSEEKQTSHEDSSDISGEITDIDDHDTQKMANKEMEDLTPKLIEIKEESQLEIYNIVGIEQNDMIIDGKEFIFLNAEQQTEKKPDSSEELEEFTTEQNTEISESSRVKRNFRSDNVIEEENLAATQSTYKFTWHDHDHDRDTKLSNSLMFKNINA